MKAKQLFLALMIVLLLSQSSRAQEIDYDCTEIITFKFGSDGGIWVSEYVEVTEDNQRTQLGMVLAVPDDASVLMVTMVTSGIGCIPEGAAIEIELSDLTVLSFASDNKRNCSGRAYLLFGDGWQSKRHLRKLCKADIVSISIRGNSGLVKVYLGEDDALYLQASFLCLGNIVGMF